MTKAAAFDRVLTRDLGHDPGVRPAGARARDAMTEEWGSTAGQSLDLFLLRHADAGDSGAWAGDDVERPLSTKGREQCRRLGRHLDAIGVDVQAILTSPRVRAADTARIVGKALGVRPSIDARLDAGFDRRALQAILDGLEATVSAVVLVGHDPDFSDLASWLTDSTVAMRKGAMVRIELPGRAVGAGAGALRWLLPPDAISG